MRIAVAALTTLLVFAVPAAAQDRAQTLADIRQELTVLHVEVQKLKRELSTSGAPETAFGGKTVLERVAALEAELQQLTAKTETLQNRIDRVVRDGTNRIGDLEFRLVELEGGDVSKLGETTTLGGPEEAAALAAEAPQTPAGTKQPELAVGEEADFKAASKAAEDGDYAGAAEMFAAFNRNYPGSPLAAEADLRRGRALDQTGDTRAAARAYLDSFSADNTGPVAPEALFELGAALGRLQQTEQACITLAEVPARFPNADAVARARAEMGKLGCS